MIILAFDTSSSACSVAVGTKDKIFAERSEIIGMGHAIRLIPLIQEVLREAGITFKDLQGITTIIGPGSFTGLRVGISAARGLALSGSLKSIGLISFDVLYEEVASLYKESRDILVGIDSKREDLYLKLFKQGRGEEPFLATTQEIKEQFKESPLTLIGDGALKIAEQLANDMCALNFEVLEKIKYPSPSLMVKMAALFLEQQSFNYKETLLPYYLREADVTKPA